MFYPLLKAGSMFSRVIRSPRDYQIVEFKMKKGVRRKRTITPPGLLS